MKPRIVVVCVLVRDHPEPYGEATREFCDGCRDRVWLSETSKAACREHDARALPMCGSCARAGMGEQETIVFLEATAETVREAAEALGISEDEARRLGAQYAEDWRAGRLE